jgi:translation elongation factor EF-1beta
MAKKETTNEVKDFVNPFEAGVNYKVFLEAVGEMKVEDYCKDKLTEEQIDFLINDLKHYKQK